MPAEVRGVTAFAPPPAPKYAYELASEGNKICISLEHQQSKHRWSTGYMTEEIYLTNTNRIANARIADYISIFKDALGSSSGSNQELRNSSKTRRLIPLKDNILRLELSVNVQVVQSAMEANFVFQLEPVSVERIDILEAKLRDVQDELEATKRSLAQAATKKMTHLEASASPVAELNKDGHIIWNALETDQFKLTSLGAEIRFLVSGWYIVSAVVDLEPEEDGALVYLRKNGDTLVENKLVELLAQSDQNQHHVFFSEDRLIRLFTEYPARPLPVHWNVVHEGTQDQQGASGSRPHLRGKVTSWSENGGRYSWEVTLSDWSTISMEVQALEECVVESYRLGVDVMATSDSAPIADYISIFKEVLDYAVDSKSSGSNEEELGVSKTRRLIPLDDNNLRLELATTVQVLRSPSSAWEANFVFQLKPVPVERIDILEAKLRDVQQELEETKRSLTAELMETKLYLAQPSTKKMTHLEVDSDNVAELNKGGWNAVSLSSRTKEQRSYFSCLDGTSLT